jgi:hypothetical protein
MAPGKPQNTAPKPSVKKAGTLSQKEQSKRFKEAARELGVDESGKAFSGVINRLLPRASPSREPS